ncbi:hypothetical protein P3342_006277 [Pyrenophora teres f. teres]|nr:hypothetical protein P3342_006277 [Pyrenophora teres f. teres]
MHVVAFMAEEMKELNVSSAHGLRPTRVAHDISPIMHAAYGVFGMASSSKSISDPSSSTLLTQHSEQAPVAAIRLVPTLLARTTNQVHF